MRYGLLGEHLGHSFSRELHEALGRYPYALIELPPEELEAFFLAKDFAGINVTIPYKQAVIPYLDEISPRAKAIGAVNTVVNRNGRLCGGNTDFGGLEALIRGMGVSLSGATVLICGTGGTSRTAAAVAESLGAAKTVRLSRSGREGAAGYDAAYTDFAGADFLINATPCGMYPDTDGMPLDPARFPRLRGVADAVYNPLTTRLAARAREKGIPAENGLRMLVEQAVLASEAFTGAPYPAGTAEKLYRSMLFEKRSIVLTGMPGSGKTTLGRLLAARLGRTLYDTDGLISARAGMPITEIFRTQGERAFRDMESALLRELCASGGSVIATGGGAVLRPENVARMKQNGTVVFLDRPPETLVPTDDRPLADNSDKILALYHERYPIYTAAADLRLPVEGAPERTAEKLLEALR